MAASPAVLEVNVLTHTDEDVAFLARSLFANEVQGSFLDMMAYDTDKDRKAFWFAEAEKWAADRVRARQAAGEPVVYVRATIIDGQSIVTRRVA